MQIKTKNNSKKTPTRKPKGKPQSIHIQNDEIKYSFYISSDILTGYV